MKKNKLVICLLLIITILIGIKDVGAYGYGFKRNNDGIAPDVGIYKDIIEQNGGYYVGNSQEKVLYLTFDCGYENGYTEKILEVLKEKQVKATFFITGHYLHSAKDLVMKMINDGHIVANHSDKHKDITKLSFDELKKEIKTLEDDYLKITGSKIASFFRPPAGNFDAKSLSYVEKLGYTSLFWSVAYVDWKKSNADPVSSVCDYVHNGAIILLHAVSNENAQSLAKIIDNLHEKGYRFETPYYLLGDSNGVSQ